MISDDAELAELLPGLQDSPWIAVDTEADSLHSYPEKLCLIQVSFAGGDRLIDPLASLSLEPLFELLGTRELLLHGADFDLRLLRRAQGFVAESVFDTMLAARLLGFEKFGLRDLARDLLDVHLDKGSQRANWSRRPLTPRMLEYAMADTRHLEPLASQLREQLEERGRLAWHSESCARLVAACKELSVPDPERVWRLKGSSRLDRRALAVLRSLWRWREGEARARNRPPYFVVSHENLLGIAKRSVEDAAAPLPEALRPRQRREVRAEVEAALGLPPESWPKRDVSTRPPRLAPDVRRRIDELRARRDTIAEELAIHPTLIANKAELTGLAERPAEQSGAMMSWQRALLDV